VRDIDIMIISASRRVDLLDLSNDNVDDSKAVKNVNIFPEITSIVKDH